MLPKAKATVNIENVVASATLKQRVDLNAVVKSYPGVEYRPEQFPGLVFRLKRPKTATLIFNSGKMVCTGAKSEKEARRAVMRVVKELKKSGIVIISKPELRFRTLLPLRTFMELLTWRRLRLFWGARCMSLSSFPGLFIAWTSLRWSFYCSRAANSCAQELSESRTFTRQLTSCMNIWRKSS